MFFAFLIFMGQLMLVLTAGLIVTMLLATWAQDLYR